jgi:hypothetical protein
MYMYWAFLGTCLLRKVIDLEELEKSDFIMV